MVLTFELPSVQIDRTDIWILKRHRSGCVYRHPVCGLWFGLSNIVQNASSPSSKEVMRPEQRSDYVSPIMKKSERRWRHEEHPKIASISQPAASTTYSIFHYAILYHCTLNTGRVRHYIICIELRFYRLSATSPNGTTVGPLAPLWKILGNSAVLHRCLHGQE